MENINPKLSIIIPIYNVEDYLPKCIESILEQSFDDFEVIAIDDGSTDRSGEILNEYAKKDSRINAIHVTNGGVSNARNIGLDQVRGEYIGFVDSDDIIAKRMYEKLLKEAENDKSIEIVQCQYLNVFTDSELSSGHKKHQTVVIENNEIIVEWLKKDKIHSSVCTKIFRRSIIGNIRFSDQYAVAEDELFVFECLKKTKKIKIIDDICYFYLQRVDSAVHQKFGIKNWGIINIIDVYKEHYDKSMPMYCLVECNEANACVSIILGIIRENVYRDKYKEIRRKLMKLKWKVFFRKEFSAKVKLITLMLFLCPGLFGKLYRKYKYICNNLR